MTRIDIANRAIYGLGHWPAMPLPEAISFFRPVVMMDAMHGNSLAACAAWRLIGYVLGVMG